MGILPNGTVAPKVLHLPTSRKIWIRSALVSMCHDCMNRGEGNPLGLDQCVTMSLLPIVTRVSGTALLENDGSG